MATKWVLNATRVTKANQKSKNLCGILVCQYSCYKYFYNFVNLIFIVWWILRNFKVFLGTQSLTNNIFFLLETNRGNILAETCPINIILLPMLSHRRKIMYLLNLWMIEKHVVEHLSKKKAVKLTLFSYFWHIIEHSGCIKLLKQWDENKSVIYTILVHYFII